MIKRLSTLALTVLTAASILIPPAGAETFIPLTPQQALSKYNRYYTDYTKDELVNVGKYRSTYANLKGSLANNIVERAIWYMNNGYAVYGSGRRVYGTTGVVDCTNFISMVFSDFKYDITTVSRDYDTVGTKVPGVYPVKVGNYWTLKGTQNLRPGDILTWYKYDENGKYISHAAIYMGMLNGQPAVIGTRSAGNPTGLGIVNDFRWWWGSNFNSARRVLPSNAWTPGATITGHEQLKPIIPTNPILPPQKPISMPAGETRSILAARPTDSATYVTPKTGWITYRTGPSSTASAGGRLYKDQYVKVARKYNAYWYQLSINGKTVYIPTNPNYIDVLNPPASPAYPTKYVTPKSSLVSYRTSPSSTATVSGRLQAGEYAKVLSKYNAYWYKISINGKTAYTTTNSQYVSVITR